MGKWTPDGHHPDVVDMGNGHRFVTEDADIARYVYTAHNADIERLQAERDEALAKLADVRMNIGCARGQRTTQFCAEAVRLQTKLDKVMALSEPPSWADIIEAGGAVELTTQRLDKIRTIVEGE